MKNTEPQKRTRGRDIFSSSLLLGEKLLPYLVVTFLAVIVAQIRWYMVDSEAYFITGTAARRTYYAIRDMSYDDAETMEKLRDEVSDSIVGVLVKGAMKSQVGFDDECEILLNQPLEDSLLPLELRELLDGMTLDRRELLIATVRSIHDDLQYNTNFTKDDRDEFIWQRIGLMESDPSSGNVIFQILSTLTDGDQKIDPNLTERVRELAASDIEKPRKIFYAGDRILNRGEIVTPQIAQVLRLQGYPEGRYPWAALLFGVVVAWVSVFWIRKTMNHSSVIGTYHGEWTYPFFLLILGWFFQVGVVYWGINGLGLFPVIAIIYLTLPDLGALSCVVATVFSASIITTGYDLTAFAVNTISGCAGAILGISLFKKNFSRSAVWLHSLLLGIAMLFVAVTVQVGLTHSVDFRLVSIMTLTVLMLSFMVIVLLPLLEILFDIVSPLQLVELTQPSQPLLRQLQVEAPGTYNHCQMVGNLAEAAAEAIGLNPMLLRAGACFHDIGKLRRPGLFVENQLGGANSHDEMSPAMSAMIILSHVKDGLELADENRLPSQIKAFIAEHHGTTCLTYFYKKAMQAGLNAEESQFCYPGPKPQSKETGVLMMADSTEAAARAESSHLRGIHDLARLVDSVVQSKMDSGQLSDVPFTLSDISKIKSAMIKTLNSMYHTRNIKPLQPSAAEQGKDSSNSHGSTTAVSVQAQAAHEERS